MYLLANILIMVYNLTKPFFIFLRSILDPNPPRNMTIEKVTSNSVLVHWESPKHSQFSSYAIRYRTESEKEWFNLPSVRTTEADVTDMTPGEKYTIQVNTVSYGVESPSPQQVNQTVRPNPVSGIIPVADSTNITLEWPRPEGRIETYVLSWWPTEKSSSIHTKNVSESNVCKYFDVYLILCT